MNRISNIPLRTLRKIWQRVPSDYYEVAVRRNFLQRIWHGKRLKILTNLLDPEARRILDLGCAAGHFSAKIQASLPHAEVVGVDVYEPFVQLFRKRHPRVSCVCADAHHLPFTKGRFDAVVLSEVLDHVVDPRVVLSEVKRVLRPGGTLIISLDELSFVFRIVWWFWIRVDPGKVWWGAHLHHFTSESFERLLTLGGFSVVQRKAGFFGMIRFFRARK